MTLSIIIVDYKTTQQANALAKKLVHKNWECFVVDNNKTNRGYGGGLNFGASRTTGEYLLLLNPDIEISVIQIETLLQTLIQHKEYVAVGPQFVEADGDIVPSSLGELTFWSAFIGLSFLHNVWPLNLFSKTFWLSDWDRKTTREVSTINGACMLVRRTDFEQAGKFDEQFFLYWEENDLCDRLRKSSGRKIMFISTVSIHHQREHSVSQNKVLAHAAFLQSRQLYLYKKFGSIKGLILSTWLRLAEFRI